jgi:hypothetical protein
MQDVPYGYCHCGCGEKTRIAPYNHTRSGTVAGEPLRYISNHHRRKTVDEYYIEEDRGYKTPCWIWTGTTRHGYGRIYREGRLQEAHRWYYEQANGPIPEGLQINHLCRVPSCVNPDHLEPVTRAENVRRGYEANPVTHCRRGHEFTPENTILVPGGKMCRICDNARQRRSYYRRKARQQAEGSSPPTH